MIGDSKPKPQWPTTPELDPRKKQQLDGRHIRDTAREPKPLTEEELAAIKASWYIAGDIPITLEPKGVRRLLATIDALKAERDTIEKQKHLIGKVYQNLALELEVVHPVESRIPPPEELLAAIRDLKAERDAEREDKQRWERRYDGRRQLQRLTTKSKRRMWKKLREAVISRKKQKQATKKEEGKRRIAERTCIKLLAVFHIAERMEEWSRLKGGTKVRKAKDVNMHPTQELANNLTALYEAVSALKERKDEGNGSSKDSAEVSE